MSLNVPIVRSSKVNAQYETTVLGGHRIVTSGRYAVLGLHGVGVINGRDFVTTPEDLAVALQGYQESPDRLGSSIRGSLTVYVEDLRNHEVHVLADPFGASIVFSWDKGESNFVSSSLPGLIAGLKSHGYAPKKSLKYAALLASSNNGGLVDSPYEDVGAIDQFTYLTFSNAGVSSLTYSIKEDVFGNIARENSKIAGLQAKVIDEILNNIKAASRYEAPTRICHLTGGMDSRTVLAGLFESGYADMYQVHCGGDPLSDDMQISRRLAHALGLSMTRDSGLKTGVLPNSPAEESRWSMHETHGVLRGPAHPGLHTSKSVVLSGGFGGLLRNSFGPALSIVPKPGFRGADLYGPMLGTLGVVDNNGESILNDALVEHAKNRIDETFNEFESLDIPNDVFPEFLWFRFRSRYYVGEISRSLSKYVNRFDPLYSPWILALAWSYGRQERGQNFVHLDLLRALSEKLAMIPYDKPRITDAYLEARPEAEVRELPNRLAPLAAPESTQAPLILGTQKVSISSEHYAEARRVGLPPATVGHSEIYRKRAQKLVAEADNSEISSCFNLAKLDSLLKNAPKWRPQYRSIRDLHDSLSWYVS